MLRDVEFKRLCGLKRPTFEAMREELRAAELAKTKPGRPYKLSLEDPLLMTLWYWREYRTLLPLGTPLGVSEGTAGGGLGQLRVVVVDATDTSVEQPKKKQRRFYRGKRKRHTVKSAVLIDRHSGRILAMAPAPGRYHDLRRRRQAGSCLPPEVYTVVDLGYQGFQHEHRLTVLPFQATKTRPLDAMQRAINRVQARRRIRKEETAIKSKTFSSF